MGTLSRIAGSALLAFACSAGGTQAAKADDDGIKHVLLVSVDGLHAIDLANCKAAARPGI